MLPSPFPSSCALGKSTKLVLAGKRRLGLMAITIHFLLKWEKRVGHSLSSPLVQEASLSLSCCWPGHHVESDLARTLLFSPSYCLVVSMEA